MLFDKKHRSIYTIIAGVFFSVVGFFMTYLITLDLLIRDDVSERITVKRIDLPGKRAMIETEIVPEDGPKFRNMYGEFTLREGEEYKIVYLKRTRIILEVEGQ